MRVVPEQEGLQVETLIEIDQLGDRFEKENPGMEEFDRERWKKYFEKNQKFKTLCLDCLKKRRDELRGESRAVDISASSDEDEAGEDNPFAGMEVNLNAASVGLLKWWYQRAQERGAALVARSLAGGAAVSDDEEGDDIGSRFAREGVQFNAASTAIAIRWLTLAEAGSASAEGLWVRPAALRGGRQAPKKGGGLKSV